MLALLVSALIASDKGCQALCIREGYTDGKAKGKSCECAVLIDETYKDFAMGRRTIGEIQVQSEDAPIKPVKYHWTNPTNDED